MQIQKTLRPDAKGRINLGQLASGVSGFKLDIDAKQRIILEPLVEIPAIEKWIFDNPAILCQIQSGIKDAAEGKLNKMDFSEFLDDEK